MFDFSMQNYNIFIGGCCVRNNILNAMFTMQMFESIINNIFHLNKPQQKMMPMMPKTNVMPMQFTVPMQNMCSPSIFPAYNVQSSMNYYNNFSYNNSYSYINFYNPFKNIYNNNIGINTLNKKSEQKLSGDSSLSKKERIQLVKEHLKRVEGGYACVKGDKGGATKHGVTHGAYDDHRRRKHLPLRSVKEMTDEEFTEIIEYFWNKSGASEIKDPILAFYVFSTDWGSGIGKSKQFLKQCGGNPEKFEELRRAFYNRIAVGTNAQFRRGWQNRVTRDHDFAYSKLA